MKTKAPVVILSVLLAGCASSGGGKQTFKQLPDVTYRAPTNPPAPSTIADVEGTVAQTVAKVIESLNGPRFGITHVDQSKGLITATFEADPDDFLDCGELDLVSSQGETTTVPAASRQLTYEVPINNKTRVGSINRELNLDGRLLIEVTASTPGRSRVKVSGDYVLTRTGQLKGTSAQTLKDETRFLAFGSGQAVSFGGSSTICQSNGELEQQALAQGSVASASSLGAAEGTFGAAEGTFAAAPTVASPVPSLGTSATSVPAAPVVAAPVPEISTRTKRSAFPEDAAAPVGGNLERVRSEFAKIGCAPLTAVEDESGIRVSGFVGSQDELDQLKQAVRSLEGVGDVSFQVVVTSASFCEILQVSLPLHERNSIESAGASIGVDGSAVVLQEGDQVVLQATSPNFESYIYIMYMQEDGKLLNLVPSRGQPNNRRGVNEQFSIGDQPDQPSFTVSPPYGDDLVMLVASSEPLFEQPRGLIETGSVFADDLARSVEAILNRGGNVVADLVFLRTSPRSS